MVLRLGFAIVLALVMLPGRLFADQLEELKQKWRGGNYREALPLLVAYWKQPGGRTWATEYMIGTSECRLPGLPENGKAMLQDVLQNFQLPAGVRPTIESELRACEQGVVPQDSVTFTSIPVIVQIASGAHVSGKGGYIIHPSSSLANSRIESTPVPVQELQRRLYDLSRGQEALRAASMRMNGAAAGSVVLPFVVTTLFANSSVAERTGKCLLRYKNALESQFQMNLPSSVIAVYSLPDLFFLNRYANSLHGITLPPGTVAYSVYEDLSIVGIGGPESCGSLAHELVHIMIRRNFGNSPAWLEEGLASEIAVGRPLTDSVSFERSWRDEMLKAHWGLRPTVTELLNMNWTSFVAASDKQMEKVAAVHAMAASFVRYLAAKNQLSRIYFGIRDQRFDEELVRKNTDRQIVEQSLGKNLDDIDKDFVNWFQPDPVGGIPTQTSDTDFTNFSM